MRLENIEPLRKKIVYSVTFFIVPRNTTQNMVFQVDSEPIADMNWFWLDKKAAPTGRLFCAPSTSVTCWTSSSSTTRSVLDLWSAACL